MAAGAAALELVDGPLLERVDDLGERLRAGFNRAFRRQGVRGQATGIGSLANIHLTDQPISDARDSLVGIIAGGAVSGLLHLLMLERGIFGASRLMYCTSAAMTSDDVGQAVAALEDALATLEPDLEREAPHLLV
jgi:glutamate-1-semialdehyde 2,1-aminomutase